MNKITVRVKKDGDMFLSHCLDYDVASQGQTRQEALENIKEAVSLFLECAYPSEVSACKELQGDFLQLNLDGV